MIWGTQTLRHLNYWYVFLCQKEKLKESNKTRMMQENGNLLHFWKFWLYACFQTTWLLIYNYKNKYTVWRVTYFSKVLRRTQCFLEKVDVHLMTNRWSRWCLDPQFNLIQWLKERLVWRGHEINKMSLF